MMPKLTIKRIKEKDEYLCLPKCVPTRSQGSLSQDT